MSTTQQEVSKPLPKKKVEQSSAFRRLTPSEIESLRQDKKQASEYCRKHLPPIK